MLAATQTQLFFFVLSQIVLFGGAFLYFNSLNETARHAVLFALPKRRHLSSTQEGRRFLSKFFTAEVEKEHAEGIIDLETFKVGQIIPSPVVRGDVIVGSIKRFIDLAVSVSLALFVAPVLVCTAIAIKIDSPGPVFYRQVRVGKNGHHFKVIKFRSMSIDAEKGGAQWAAQQDVRVTRVGRFIRDTRIDEIPQVINVIRGEMSFVGPRPERPEFIDQLSREIEHYDERHRVKPGLTGWAQVNYPYGASVEDSRAKLRYDLYYIKNFSLLLDLFIIVRTIRVAVKGVGAR